MQRVHRPVVGHGRGGRQQALGDDLAAVDAAPGVLGRGADERVGPVRLEEQQLAGVAGQGEVHKSAIVPGPVSLDALAAAGVILSLPDDAAAEAALG